MALKENLQLFSRDELEEIGQYIHDKIDSYYNASEEYREEWNKWNRAYNCVYKKEDHSIETNAKLYDPESADAIDTVSKRINVAIFSNDKISELTFNEYEDTELHNVSQAMWDKKLDELNYRLTLEEIIKSGVINGTYIAKVIPNEKRHLELVTKPNGDREVLEVIDTTPLLKYVSIYDFFADPTQSNIRDSEVIAEKLCIDESELKDDDYYISENIDNYRDFFRKDTQEKTPGDTEVDEYKEIFYQDSGVTIQDLIRQKKRYVYHVFFNWKNEDDVDCLYFAVVDAVTFKVLRIEYNYYDGNEIPYRTCHYLTRPGCLYGIGAAEQAGALQEILNDIYNGFLDNIQTLNEMAFLASDNGTIEANEVTSVGKFKFVTVMNPEKVVPIIPHGLPDVMAVSDKLREQIQKKTKATMLMQGLPMEGTRTATEMIGIREEQNLSIKDIIDNTVQNFIEPLFNLYRHCMAQFYEADNIKLKVPVNDVTNTYKVTTISFDEIRDLFAKADIKITSVAEQNQKAMELNELKGLLQIALQRPDVLNMVEILKKIYFDLLGMKDFDKFLTNNIMAGTPVDPQQENIILNTGTPLNTHIADNHIEHLQLHQMAYQQLKLAGQNDQTLAVDQVMQEQFIKTLMNFENHIKEHIFLIEKNGVPEGATQDATNQPIQ